MSESTESDILTIPLVYSPLTETSPRNILLIDSCAKDSQFIYDSVNSDTFPILYSYNSTKSDLLAVLKQYFTTIDRIGVFCDSLGESSSLFLDNKPFFLSNEASPYSENVEFIINVLKEFQVKNIDYLACNTLQYSDWTNYYTIISSETPVIIGASNDKTGNLKYGGDWIMESTNQDVELLYFTENIQYYQYLLDASITVNGIN